MPRLLEGIPPYSFRAVGIAVLCFGGALAVQIVARSIGGSVMFATYFPAVVVTGLLAGLPAGVFLIFAVLLTVWWAFIPPPFLFHALSSTQQLDVATFLLSSACILVVTESYRAALRQVRQQEKERELLVKELEHRGNNTYAVVDVIVQKTLEDQPERAAIIGGRIRAIRYANDLVNEAPKHTVLLKSLLFHEFVAYDEAQCQTKGPDVELAPDTARHLALVFHELVTNAVKYGALSKSDGCVVISWKHEDGVITLEWTEQGGPVVAPPKKHGFGSRIVTQSLRSVGGSITPTFAPEGLHCLIKFCA
jgi:two-component sensor histidine kinase